MYLTKKLKTIIVYQKGEKMLKSILILYISQIYATEIFDKRCLQHQFMFLEMKNKT